VKPYTHLTKQEVARRLAPDGEGIGEKQTAAATWFENHAAAAVINERCISNAQGVTVNSAIIPAVM
jgi:hypothetical protein